ncbi:hypothetical protein Tco_1478213, partial [Tanacetum coccineum]
MPRDCLAIIESKSKVRHSRSKAIDSKVSMSTSTPGVSPNVAELKEMVKALLLDKKNQSQAPATVKAVEESCVTCGGAHSYHNCPTTDCNVYRDNIQEYVSHAAAVNYNQGNTGYHPPMEKLNLPDLTKTRMILELADRTISTPTGIAENVFVKRTTRDLIDVHGEQMTFRHDDQFVTFKVSDTKTFSYNIIESVNRVDVIDVACEEFSQEVLGFSNISKSGNPTLTLEPILSTSPTSLTLFEGGNFILEEIEACITSESIPLRIDDADFDPKEDLLTLERFLNSDPSSTLPLEEQKYKELKTVKPSSDELPELELKDLLPHLEYAFLEGTNKLPVIIAKDLKDEDKTALL